MRKPTSVEPSREASLPPPGASRTRPVRVSGRAVHVSPCRSCPRMAPPIAPSAPPPKAPPHALLSLVSWIQPAQIAGSSTHGLLYEAAPTRAPTADPAARPMRAKRFFRGRWPVDTSMRVTSASGTVTVKSRASAGRTTSVSEEEATTRARRGSSPSAGALIRRRVPTANVWRGACATPARGTRAIIVSSTITVRMAAPEVERLDAKLWSQAVRRNTSDDVGNTEMRLPAHPGAGVVAPRFRAEARRAAKARRSADPSTRCARSG